MNSFSIRTALPEDAEQLLKIYAPYVTDTAVSFEYTVPSEEEFSRRIRAVLLRYPYLVAEADGYALGYAYAGAFHPRAAYDWDVETSIYVRADLRRGGIGRALYTALENSLQEQGILNLNACIACPTEPDKYLSRDSIAFHEKLGYRMVGQFSQCGYKFDRWYDMVWMEKHIGAHLPVQPPVKSFERVRGILFEKYGQK